MDSTHHRLVTLLLVLMVWLPQSPLNPGSTPVSATAEGNSKCHPDLLAPRLLVLALDGVRWDQVLSPRYPGFGKFIQSGVRAEYMEPVFPTNTFVNFYTLATGLWPESSGILDNFMYDAHRQASFLLGEQASDFDTFWWQEAEPLWISAAKQRLVSHLHFWPGCEAQFQHSAPELCRPYEASLTLANFSAAIAEVLEDFRHGCVQFAGVYTPNTDFVGHDFGPDSSEMDKIIAEIDGILSDMMQKMSTLRTPMGQPLSEVVNVLIVSDHGMAATPPANGLVPLYKYIDVDTLERSMCRTPSVVCHFWPKKGLLEKVHKALSAAEHVRLYRKGDIPARFHGANHERVAPLVVVADVGWQLGPIELGEQDAHAYVGHHGYDNSAPEMAAVFLASGPGFRRQLVQPPISTVDVYQLMCHLLAVTPRPHNGTWDHVADMLV